MKFESKYNTSRYENAFENVVCVKTSICPGGDELLGMERVNSKANMASPLQTPGQSKYNFLMYLPISYDEAASFN